MRYAVTPFVFLFPTTFLSCLPISKAKTPSNQKVCHPSIPEPNMKKKKKKEGEKQDSQEAS